MVWCLLVSLVHHFLGLVFSLRKLDGLHVSHFASSLVAWDHQRILDCGCFIGTVEEDEGGEGLEDMETFESDEKMLMAGGLEEKGLIQGQIGSETPTGFIISFMSMNLSRIYFVFSSSSGYDIIVIGSWAITLMMNELGMVWRLLLILFLNVITSLEVASDPFSYC
ncbi:hypothetical protein V6N12_031018 [Hibiscus sabdariffa]|uniref:Uncharacterized protein n=1 Tax=Hibiscus sabdariffa TaxID=183260 RepID=A0ABR2EB96_9ROSI